MLRLLGAIDVTDLPRNIPALLEMIERTHARNLSEDDVTALLFRPNGLVPRLPLRNRLLAPYHFIRAWVGRLWEE